MKRRNFIRYRLLPIIFIMVLVFPLVNKYITIIEPAKSHENRKLATIPEFDINHLDPFPGKYEDYYNDNFSLRNNFTKFYNYVRFKYLEINPYPGKVVLGKDGWMFYKNKMLPTNWEKNIFSEEELDTIKSELLDRKAYLDSHNCKFYIGVIPTKHTVYYNKFKDPKQLDVDTTLTTIGEQFVNYIDSTTDINIVYFRPTLLKHKKDYTLFRKYDHHWNNLGGFFAASVMLDEIQKDFPELKMTIDFNDFDLVYKQEDGGDLAMILGIEGYVSEELPQLIIKDQSKKVQPGKKMDYPIPENFNYGWGYEVRRTTKNDSLPNCMIIRDSNGSYLKDYISYGFNNTFMLWDSWKYQINEEIFLQEKPDVFIILIPENALEKLKNKWE